MKKRLLHACIVLFLLLLVIDGMSCLLFDVAQAVCKFESQRSISEKKGLQVLNIPLKTFSQHNNKHEIWIDGSLYDISEYHISGDRVSVTVFHDNDEELLVNDLISCFEATGNAWYNYSGHHISRISSKVINDCKILPRQLSYARMMPPAKINTAAGYYYFHASSVYAGIIKPPPIYAASFVS